MYGRLELSCAMEVHGRKRMQALKTASMNFPEWLIYSPGISSVLFATRLKTQILAKERQHMVLKTIRDSARMRTGVQFETVRNAVFPENIVQLLGVYP